MNVTRTFDLLERYGELFIKDDVLCFKQNGEWKKFSTREYIDYSYNFCYGLYEAGLRKGDKIITVSTSRPEWNFVDMGMSMLGVVHVPVFTSLSIPEYEFIIKNSDARMVIISDNRLFKTLGRHLIEKGFADRLYTFDFLAGVKNWMELVEKGKTCSEKTKEEI